MRLVFRKFPAGDPPVPAAGEVHVRPRQPEYRDRWDLARLALELGEAPFVRGEGTVERIVVQHDPTLDDMLAATFLEQRLAGRDLPPGAADFAKYAEMARQGKRPCQVPLGVSLVGVYLAVRNLAGPDLTDAEAARRFGAGWARMAARILRAADAREDPFRTALFAEGAEFADERAYLAEDERLYRQDVQNGERWLMRLPGGAPQVAGLLLRKPQSMLWKFWSRSDPQAPSGAGYLFLAVYLQERHWRFSTDPVARLSIGSLAEPLQRAEAARDPGRAAKDPWYDGRRHGRTIVGAPNEGTVLSEEEVLRVVRRWAGTRPLVRGKGRWPVLAAAAAGLVAVTGLAWGLRGFVAGTPPEPTGAAQAHYKGLDPDPEPERERSGPRSLFLLAVGVSKYKNPQYQLDCPRKDAEALAKAFQDQRGRAFANVSGEVLVDQEATRDGIVNALDQLAHKALTQHDLVVVTVSGHGANNDNDNYYFLPYDYNDKASGGVYWDDFKRSLGYLPCPVLVVMDTCHSGTITKSGFRDAQPQKELERAVKRGVDEFGQTQKGVVVMAACLSQQRALEKQVWDHGALTLALLEGITGQRLYGGSKGEALPQEQGRKEVSLKDLDSYVTYRVQELVGGGQAVVTNHTGNIALQDILISKQPDEPQAKAP
jgi:hypothetical protein